MSHDETIRREFTKQAKHFAEQNTLSNADLLTWMVDVIAPKADWSVLDVATGTGHLARALAPRVRRVTAVDLTREMLRRGQAEAERAGLRNIEFHLGAAEHLPCRDGAFDLVATRFSLHHFADPRPPLREMVRACRPGGRVGVVDLLASADRALAEHHNHLERLRDPSHVRALTEPELLTAVEAVGLTLVEVVSRDVEVVFDRWCDTTETPASVRETIAAELGRELAGGPPTGMRPFRRDGRLGFLHHLAVVVAEKPARA